MNAGVEPSRIYFRTLIAISVAMVCATITLRFGKGLILAPLNLTNENVVAAWFSGMLLLLGALHAADGYLRLRKTHLKAALAWWVIAAMLLFMSADEIGSLHERMKYLMRMGPWLSFLPFFIVLMAGCVWSFLQLWLTPSERRFVPGLILGFAILVSVGGQEFLERTIKWPWYLAAFRAGFEEGSELTGMLILIHTTLPNSMRLFGTAPRSDGAAFSSVLLLRWFFVLLAVIVAWPLAQLSSVLEEQAGLGHPSDWLACALFAFAAALLIARSRQSPTGSRGLAAAVAFLLVGSAVCVQIDPIGDDAVFPFTRSILFLGLEWNVRLLLLGLSSLGAAEALRSRGDIHRSGAILLGLSGLCSVVISGYSPAAEALRWAYFVSTLVGVAALAALAPSRAFEPVGSESASAAHDLSRKEVST